jgi:tripartite-type tricarboxylate transporter receptor subunit TctC
MKISVKTNSYVCFAFMGAIVFVSGSAQAQPAPTVTAYPTKSVRIIVASVAGGGSDFIGRLLAQKLSDALGQQVIVENRAGAGSTLGIEAGIRAAPDGYTFNLITPSYSINPSLYNLKFDPVNDYTPIVPVARGPLVASILPSVPAKTLRDLIALAKARPGQIVYGSAGQGTIVHLANALFLHGAGVQMVHVPYKGGAPALTDLMAGQISLVFATPQTGLPQVKAGRIRALAVTTATRIAADPSIPTIAEAGVPGYDVSNWHGLIGPKSLPRAVVERINSEINKIVRSKEMEDRLRADGVSPAGGTPEVLQEQIRREIAMWRDAVKAADIKIQ